ncbi:MAG TPA: hypothetical protein VKE98_02085 [Gemmataceae bacterium]|nr:hypothetical protein [Gemmataceae bacterium]
MANLLEREKYIEQAYFYRVFRERLATNMATQDVLEHVHQEILSITRLPLAIQFLATELKHSGILASGFARLPHYFTAFQSFVVSQAEKEGLRFNMETALLILEREARYRAENVTPAGLFVFQFEALCRNRLGYDQGLESMRADPYFDEDWRAYLEMVRNQIGVVDFADLVYLRSQFYVHEQKRLQADYEPPLRPLFGEKEGKIARANRGRDPLYLFAALQRQLGYPEVPHTKPRDDLTGKILTLQAKMRELEIRLKLVEGEVKGQVDLSQFLAKPDTLPKPLDDS